MKPSADTLKKLKIDPDAVRYIYRAYDPVEDAPKTKDDDERGNGERLRRCGGTGYQKRTGIFDLLVVTDKIRELIRENPNVQEIRKVRHRGGH